MSDDFLLNSRERGSFRRSRLLGLRVKLLLCDHIVQEVLSALLHVNRRKFTEPACSHFTLLLGGGKVKLLDNVDVVDIFLADFLDSVVDAVSDLRVLTLLDCLKQVDYLLCRSQFLINVELRLHQNFLS